MAATSNRNSSATKQAAPATGGTAAGLTPIWIRLPRIGDADLAGDESFDGDETARSSSQSRSAGPADTSRAADSRRDRGASGAGASRSAPANPAEEDEALEDAPAYLREIAARQRSAAFESDEEIEEEDAPATRSSQGKRRSSKPEAKPSGSFVAHIFRAPYNVLAGVALVAAFVGLYVCFKPDAGSTDAIPEFDAGPSLTLDMGEISSPPEPYVSAPEAVDPATLYPEPSLPSDGGFLPADAGPTVSGIASADYGTGATTTPASPDFKGSEFATTSPPLGVAGPGTPAINASSSVSAAVDPALAGLPLETYPETDPAKYRYPADANFDLPSGAERTAEGVSVAPRAASLGDTLEKTPVR